MTTRRRSSDRAGDCEAARNGYSGDRRVVLAIWEGLHEIAGETALPAPCRHCLISCMS